MRTLAQVRADLQRHATRRPGPGSPRVEIDEWNRTNDRLLAEERSLLNVSEPELVPAASPTRPSAPAPAPAPATIPPAPAPAPATTTTTPAPARPSGPDANSIVDWLSINGMDTSLANRERLARLNGISTSNNAAMNEALLRLARAGTLRTSEPPPAPSPDRLNIPGLSGATNTREEPTVNNDRIAPYGSDNDEALRTPRQNADLHGTGDTQRDRATIAGATAGQTFRQHDGTIITLTQAMIDEANSSAPTRQTPQVAPSREVAPAQTQTSLPAAPAPTVSSPAPAPVNPNLSTPSSSLTPSAINSIRETLSRDDQREFDRLNKEVEQATKVYQQASTQQGSAVSFRTAVENVFGSSGKKAKTNLAVIAMALEAGFARMEGKEPHILSVVREEFNRIRSTGETKSVMGEQARLNNAHANRDHFLAGLGINAQHANAMESQVVAQQHATQSQQSAQQHQQNMQTLQQLFNAGEATLNREQQLMLQQLAQAHASGEANLNREQAAMLQQMQQRWQSQEAQLNREHATAMQLATQQFGSEQAVLDRAHQALQADLGRQLTREENALARGLTQRLTEAQLQQTAALATQAQNFQREMANFASMSDENKMRLANQLNQEVMRLEQTIGQENLRDALGANYDNMMRLRQAVQADPADWARTERAISGVDPAQNVFNNIITGVDTATKTASTIMRALGLGR